MKKAIYFDLDGTLNRFYEIENWLQYLIDEDVFPYLAAAPALNFSLLARLLNKLQAGGWKLGIISWTSKKGSEEYNLAVEMAKRAWLARHLPSVEWDEIKVVRYGTNKYITCGGGILFDDEEGNRKAWRDKAYEPNQILEILKHLIKEG
jgi:FMN phosphatase YigB (HAD superfamily)